MALTPEQKLIVQRVISYASIVMGVLTTQLSGVKLPTWGSIILGVFGILLHPDTSITIPNTPPAPGTTTTTTTSKSLTA